MNHSGILKNKLFLYLTEFFAGMSVMAVELGASRLLAPYFSSSQIVWTIVIGTIMIAMALANHPDLLIADEPTTALDVTIQAQILKLMDKLVKEQGASLILITHDLAVVSQMADRIIVMYCGKIVESGSRDDVIHRPSHPYTEGLLNSIPRMGEEQKRLESIPGMVPSMLDLPQGCYFAPRCKYCQDICRTVTPENHEVSPGHCAACHFPLTGGESHE